MRERLRNVADLALAARIVFFRQHADIVRHRRKTIEERVRVVDASGERVIHHEPEIASEKRAFGFGVRRIRFGIGRGAI